MYLLFLKSKRKTYLKTFIKHNNIQLKWYDCSEAQNQLRDKGIEQFLIIKVELHVGRTKTVGATTKSFLVVHVVQNCCPRPSNVKDRGKEEVPSEEVHRV